MRTGCWKMLLPIRSNCLVRGVEPSSPSSLSCLSVWSDLHSKMPFPNRTNYFSAVFRRINAKKCFVARKSICASEHSFIECGMARALKLVSGLFSVGLSLRNRALGVSDCFMVNHGCELLSRIGGESVFWLVGLFSGLKDPEPPLDCALL